MKTIEQLLDELRELLKDPELNQIIAVKFQDAQLEATKKECEEWTTRCNKIFERQKHHMYEDEKKRMFETHSFSSSWDDSCCQDCGLDLEEMYYWPQFCLTAEEKRKKYDHRR